MPSARRSDIGPVGGPRGRARARDIALNVLANIDQDGRDKTQVRPSYHDELRHHRLPDNEPLFLARSLSQTQSRPAPSPCYGSSHSAVTTPCQTANTSAFAVERRDRRRRKSGDEELAVNEQYAQYATLQSLRDQMRGNGWCHHQVEYLARVHNVENFTYLSSQKPQRKTDHEPCKTRSSCVAYNVDMNTYQPKHVKADCTCVHIAVPYERLIHILEGDGIPLISIQHDDSQQHGDQQGDGPRYRLEVQAYRSWPISSKFVAISHVWADGLGNPKDCSLPFCQIKELEATLETVDDDIFQCGLSHNKSKPLFWMDTLCIPVKEVDRHLRQAQIDKMALIYRSAASVLVLDAELMDTSPQFSYRADPQTHEPVVRDLTTEMYAKIACSVWNQRSWTLQEGRLPSRLALKFTDDTVVMFRLQKKKEWNHRVFSCPLPWPFSGYLCFNWLGNVVQQYITVMPHKEDVLLPSAYIIERASDTVETQTSAGQDAETAALGNNDRRNHQLRQKIFSENEELASFSSVWNELAGRSTTKAEDVPMILSNFLFVENHNLHNYSSPEEMYQAILLSGQVGIPLSLFYNTGPRYLAIHRDRNLNRWVPTAISKDLLLGTTSIEARQDCLFLNYPGLELQTDFSIHMTTMNGLTSSSTRHMKFQESEAIMSVEPSNLYLEQLPPDSSDQTLIILEENITDTSEWPPARRGACFSIVNNDTRPMHSEPICSSASLLVFRGPLRLRQSLQPWPIGDDDVLHAFQINNAQDLRILYDRFPEVKPLRGKLEPKSRIWRVPATFTICWYMVTPFLCLIPLLWFWLPVTDHGDKSRWPILLLIPVILLIPQILSLMSCLTDPCFVWLEARSFMVQPRRNSPARPRAPRINVTVGFRTVSNAVLGVGNRIQGGMEEFVRILQEES